MLPPPWHIGTHQADHFASPAAAAEALSTCCLPQYAAFLPARALSASERYLAGLAWRLAAATEHAKKAKAKRRVLVCDEFTSICDRAAAQRVAAAVAAYVRRHSLRMVAVSCHDDFCGALRPDWAFSTQTQALCHSDASASPPPPPQPQSKNAPAATAAAPFALPFEVLDDQRSAEVPATPLALSNSRRRAHPPA